MHQKHLFVEADWLEEIFTNKIKLQMSRAAINVNEKPQYILHI